MKIRMKKIISESVKFLMLLSFTISNVLCAGVPEVRSVVKDLDTTVSAMNGLFFAHRQSAKKLYSSLSHLELREDIKNSIFINMVQQDELPKVNLKDDVMIVSLRGKTIKASFKEAHLNRFIVDSKVFKFAPEKSFEQNLKNLMKVLAPTKRVSFLQWLDVLLPQAHAMGGENGEGGMNMTTLLILGAVVIGGIFLFSKVNKAQDTADANAAAIADIRARQVKDHQTITTSDE